MSKRGRVENLETPTHEKAVEIGRKGGIASGKARRKKRALLDAAKSILQADIPAKMRKQITGMAGEIEDENDQLFVAATAVMMQQALKGNVAAFNSLKDMAQQLEEHAFIRERDEDNLSRALRELGEKL